MRKPRWGSYLLFVFWALRPGLAIAQGVAVEGTSDRDSRYDAITRIPVREMTREAVQKLTPVLEHPTIFRRMPRQQIECDAELFRFLVRYPEVLVNLWDLMGVTQVSVDRTAPYVFQGNDGAGTDYVGELIYGNDQIHVYYGTGTYDGPLVAKKLSGRSVCVIHGQPVRTSANGTVVDGYMDVFIKVDNLGADLLTRAISPFVVKTADYNFIESSKFVGQLADIAAKNPLAIDDISNRMTNIPSEVRQAFVDVAYRAASRNGLRANRGRSSPERATFPPIVSASEMPPKNNRVSKPQISMRR